MLAENMTVYGSTEEEVFHNKKELANFFDATADEVAGEIDLRNREISIVPLQGYVLINELFDLYVLIEGDWAFYRY